MTRDVEQRLRSDLPLLADELSRASKAGALDRPAEVAPGREWQRVAAMAAATILVLVGVVAVGFRTRADAPVRQVDTATVANPGATVASTSAPVAVPPSTSVDPNSTTSVHPPSTPAVTALPGGDMAAVSISLYSGRRDPKVTLTASEQVEIQRILDELPPSDAKPYPGRLGFSGYLLTGISYDGKSDGHIQVFEGSVQVIAADDSTTVLADDSHALMKMLTELSLQRTDDPYAIQVLQDYRAGK